MTVCWAGAGRSVWGLTLLLDSSNPPEPPIRLCPEGKTQRNLRSLATLVASACDRLLLATTTSDRKKRPQANGPKAELSASRSCIDRVLLATGKQINNEILLGKKARRQNNYDDIVSVLLWVGTHRGTEALSISGGG